MGRHRTPQPRGCRGQPGTAVSLTELRTERLLLRQWHADDLEEWAALNRDPEVMEFIGPPQSRDAAAIWLGVNRGRIDIRGWGLWAVEVPGVERFIGFVGLQPPPWEAHFTPCIEIGWRLSRRAWGHGYATEAARACLRFGFDELDLDEIVSFTTVGNVRSRAVMQRIGMHRDPADDFDHPMLTADDPLRRHVLHRLARAEWVAGGG